MSHRLLWHLLPLQILLIIFPVHLLILVNEINWRPHWIWLVLIDHELRRVRVLTLVANASLIRTDLLEALHSTDVRP